MISQTRARYAHSLHIWSLYHLNKLLEKLYAFLKANIVMTVALCAAMVTSIVVPVDAQYAGYFDVKTLSCLFSALMERSTLLFSVLPCQVISNVPSAILLSQFTGNYADLLVGVNIGGAGTLIASLASLITFRQYTSHNPGKTGYYVKMFSAFNFGFLFLLTGVMMLASAR